MRDRTATGAHAFDGIICIGGEDWWYHNRGHFDLQILRRYARQMPVLFVNSLGVRIPKPAIDGGHNKRFVEKISRKLKSFSRGLVNVENQFWVYSPVLVPGAAGQAISGWALAPQIKRAARRAGISNPLLWVHCPPGARLVDEIESVAVVLQRTDRFEAFPEGVGNGVEEDLAVLKKRADLVIYCAAHLQAEETTEVKRSILVTHGVDIDMFERAGDDAACEPEDLRALKRPRAGFLGGIDHYSFDPALFREVTGLLPDVTFPLIGNCSLPAGWVDDRPNVILMGRREYADIARYMAAMDVLIMPWNQSDWIKGINPIKAKEYLAVGRPIVTTPFGAIDDFRGTMTIATTAGEFAAAVRKALSEPYDKAPGRRFIASESWDAKADQILAAIDDVANSRRALRLTA
jgi:glycosyltransferase involved in cell wall biosynthesis